MFHKIFFNEITSAIKFLFSVSTFLLAFCVYKLFMHYREQNKYKYFYELLNTIKNRNHKLFYEKFKKVLEMKPAMINTPFDKKGNTLFLKACSMGATEIVEEMINNGADLSYVNSDGNGPFYLSAYYLVRNPTSKDATCLRLLFYSGCNINEKNLSGYTPLHLAAYFGHIPLIKWLLWKGADPNIEPLPAGLALSNGYENAACLLLKEPRKRLMSTI